MMNQPVIPLPRIAADKSLMRRIFGQPAHHSDLFFDHARRRILIGPMNDSGQPAGPLRDATSASLRALIAFVGAGNTTQVTVDGRPRFEITVRALPIGPRQCIQCGAIEDEHGQLPCGH